MGSAEKALQQLRSLDPYSAYLPALDDQILRIEQACADTLIRDGLRLLDFKNWGSAEDLLQRAAELHRDDSRIAAAQNRVERGRQAYELAARAESEATEEAFEAAMSTILRRSKAIRKAGIWRRSKKELRTSGWIILVKSGILLAQSR